MKIEAGREYIFAKSGNRVRTVEVSGYSARQVEWIVERVDTGKRMIVREKSLLDPEEAQER